jgi:hypothetical protein
MGRKRIQRQARSTSIRAWPSGPALWALLLRRGTLEGLEWGS